MDGINLFIFNTDFTPTNFCPNFTTLRPKIVDFFKSINSLFEN